MNTKIRKFLTCRGLVPASLTKSETAENQSEVLTEGVPPGELDEGGQDPAQVVPGVEEEEAGDRGEVDVGPGISRALVLTLHQDCHAGEDCQGGEEYQEDAQQIFPGRGHALSVGGAGADHGGGGGGGGRGVETHLVSCACVVPEEGGGLDSHEGHQAEYHKEKCHQEAVEANVLWTDLKQHVLLSQLRPPASPYLQSYDCHVNQGRKYPSQSLA